MNPGDFDTYITIEKNNSSANDEYNAPVANWETFISCWAKVDYGSAKESKRAEQVTGSNTNTFTIHFYPGIKQAMRITEGDNTYNILGVKAIGRRQYLQIEAETYDNE